MKSASMFPFTYGNRELYMYSDLISKYQIEKYITPVGGMDHLTEIIGSAVSENKSITTDLTDDTDTALILAGIQDDNYYMDIINKCLQLHKHVQIDPCISSQVLEKYCNHPNIKQLYNLNNVDTYDIDNRFLKKIDIPVICVMGMGDYCNKFSCELEIRRYFQNNSYKVFQLGSKNSSELFGFSNLPEFVFKKSLPLVDRIIMLNHYIFDKAREEKSDVIIIGVPGGIVPINNKVLNDFGETAFIVANALDIDATILGLYNNSLNDKLIAGLTNVCKYRYNTQVEGYCISNTAYSLDTDAQLAQLKYYHYNPENQSTKLVSVPNLFTINSKSIINVLDKIHNKLRENICVI